MDLAYKYKLKPGKYAFCYPSFTVLPPTLPSYSFPEGMNLSVFVTLKEFGDREKEYVCP